MNTEIAKLDPGATPLPWAMFFGWDPELIPNMPTLSADFLDGFSTTFPVVVIGQSGHVAWVNHKAFEVRTMGLFVLLSSSFINLVPQTRHSCKGIFSFLFC